MKWLKRSTFYCPLKARKATASTPLSDPPARQVPVVPVSAACLLFSETFSKVEETGGVLKVTTAKETDEAGKSSRVGSFR